MTPDRWRQIEDLYRAALNCPPAERAALLEATDPEIRSRVQRMLAVESGSQMLLIQAAACNLALLMRSQRQDGRTSSSVCKSAADFGSTW